MSKIICAMMVLTMSFSAMSAQNFDAFKKRFTYLKNAQGEVSYVRMNMTAKFSIAPYIKMVVSDLKAEIARLKNKDSGEIEINEFIATLEQNSDKSIESEERILAIRDSLLNLKNIDVDGVFNEITKHNALEKFKNELKDALMLLDLSVIASTEDARYFYKRNVTYEVVKRAIDFAKSKFDNIPVLNLISFIFVRVHDLVLEQRLFHQNMMLHYLENSSESDLGITVKDADRIFSSIYESRIGAINLPESNRANDNWARYGLDKFYAMVRMANNKLRRSQSTYDVKARYNYAFFEAIEDGERVIKNLVNNQHMFSGKMATAYNYDKPNEVKRFRTLLNLGQVGLGFLPLPGWLKGQVDNFIESYYVEQKRLEGALIGHFEMTGNTQMVQNIKMQLVNPYIQ